jgi:hypothetical protein
VGHQDLRVLLHLGQRCLHRLFRAMDEGGLGGAFLSLGVADVLVRWSTPAADAG